MEKINLLFLDPKGQEKNFKNILNNYVIQENNIVAENYSNGYSKRMLNILAKNNTKTNSIYGFGFFTFNNYSAYIPNELLEEVCIYGKKLYNLCKNKLLSSNKFYPFTLQETLENANEKEIIKVFIEWCKKYGFPIEPKKLDLEIDEDLSKEICYYELEYPQILELSLQFIIIYLLHTLYQDLSKHLKTNYFYFDVNNNYDGFDNTQINLSNKLISRINEFNELFFLKTPKICEDVETNYKIIEKNKIKIVNKILKEVVIVLNNFSYLFNHPSKKFFSFLDKQIYYQQVYSSVFDICWDLIATNYNNINNSQKKCKDCGKHFISITNQRYCNSCGQKRKKHKSSNTQASKIPLIKEIVDFYNNNREIIKDDNLEICKQVKCYYLLISEKGHSKELEKTRITDIKRFYEKMQKSRVVW